MKKMQAIGIVVVLLGSLFWWNIQKSAAHAPTFHAEMGLTPTMAPAQTKPLPAIENAAHQVEMSNKIRGASVLIMMQSPILHQETAEGTFLGRGIGSLIKFRGEILLVTHNHYGEVLQDLTIVEFRDADNRLLKLILGNLFKSLIIYQDAGTLILRAPEGLANQLVPASLPDSRLVKPGEVVDVVYRANAGRDNVAILKAAVEEVVLYQGLPVYKLRSLNGQYIQPGDSGGGVWQDGVLVGNNWAVLMKPAGHTLVSTGSGGEDDLVFTEMSYAASPAAGFDHLSFDRQFFINSSIGKGSPCPG